MAKSFTDEYLELRGKRFLTGNKEEDEKKKAVLNSAASFLNEKQATRLATTGTTSSGSSGGSKASDDDAGDDYTRAYLERRRAQANESRTVIPTVENRTPVGSLFQTLNDQIRASRNGMEITLGGVYGAKGDEMDVPNKVYGSAGDVREPGKGMSSFLASRDEGDRALTEAALESRLRELQEEQNELNRMRAGIAYRSNTIGLASEYDERLWAVVAEMDEVRRQLKELGRSEPATEREAIERELETAKQTQASLRGEAGRYYGGSGYGGSGNRDLVTIADESKDVYGRLTEADQAVAALERQLEKLDYVDSMEGKTYEDTFWGQTKANYRQGRLTQDVNDAFNEYLNNPTEANREYAFTLSELELKFQEENKDVLDDEGAVLPIISRSAAGYVPQFVDQAKAWLAGVGGGAVVGGLVGNPIQGARIGSSITTSAQSFGQMRGAAFRMLLEAGVDEETARAASMDEGFVSAAIEGAANYVTWGLTGAGDLIGAAGNMAIKNGSTNAGVKMIAGMFGKSAADKAAQQAASQAGKSMTSKVLGVAGKSFLDALGEYGEEFAQQGVSIANANRSGTGIWDLVKESAGTISDALTGKNDEALAEMQEAGEEGFKIGLMFGGTSLAVNTTISNYLNAKTEKQRQEIAENVRQDEESLNALIEEGKASGEGSVSAKIAAEIEQKKAAGKDVTRQDVEKLIVSNEVYIQEEARNAPEPREISSERDVSEESDTQDVREENAAEALQKPESDPLLEAAREAVGAPEAKSVPYNAMSVDNPVRQQRLAKAKSVQDITGYGEHGAASFTSIVEDTGVDPGKVQLEFQSAYEAGRAGLAQSVARLNSNVRMEAYNAGRLDAIMAMNTAQAKAQRAVIRKDAGFDMTDLPADVTRAQAKAVDLLGKATGTKIRMARGLKGNAEIAEDGSVLIDVDFERKVRGKQRSIVFYAAHEIGMHRLMQLAPEEGQAFINAVIQDANSGLMYGQETVTEKKRAQYAAQDVSLDIGKAMEEVAADSILDLYDNEDAFYAAIDRIMNGKDETAKRGAKKFKEILDDIVKKLKAAIVKLTGKERAEARQTLSEVEQLRDLFEKGLAAATERVKVENATNKPGRAAESRGTISHHLKEDGKNGQTIYTGGNQRSGGENRQAGGKRILSSLRMLNGGTRPVHGWAEAGLIVPKPGSVAANEAAVLVYEYRLPVFVVRDSIFDQNHTTAPAFAADGQVFLRETLPGIGRDDIGVHEAGHAMKQQGFAPYINFLTRVKKMMNGTADAEVLRKHAAKHCGVNLNSCTAKQEMDVYDEICNLVMGAHHAQRQADLDIVRDCFKDFDSYLAELGDIHEQFKNRTYSLKAGTTAQQAELSDANTQYSLRTKEPPKKVGVAYKVFFVKNGQLYPPMVPNPGGAGTPVGVWLDADVGEAAPPSKTGRPQVKAGGKGTQGGSGSLAFRPGWHLGDLPLATQFNRVNPETGKKELFPADFVWAECEYAMDHDYQDEAMSYGYTENGKFRHAYAGLPKLPEDGYYRYRTNPNPDTVPWVITGAMRVKRILTDAETDQILRDNGVEPLKRQGGPADLAKMGIKAGEQYSLKARDAEYIDAVLSGDTKAAQRMVDEAAETAMPDSKIRSKNGKLLPVYHGTDNSFYVFDTKFAGGKNGTAEGYGIYTSDNPEVTAAYGNRQLKMYANITKPAMSTKKTIKAATLSKLIKDTCRRQAMDMVVEGDYDSEKDALFDTWISNYVYTYDLGMERSYREAAAEILRMNDSDMAIIQEVMSGMGIRDYVSAMNFYEESLTPVTGFDGIFTQWDNAETGEKSNIILAFNSNQLKSADPVTRDDNGDVIPLSERFNESNEDIRFSLKNLDDIKAEYKDKTDHLYLHERKDGTISIDNMVVKKEYRNQGIGTQILNDVIAYADETGKTITLTPTTEFGTKAKLTRWYKANGFVENKGRNADYRLSDTMYRLPRGPQFSLKGLNDLLDENAKMRKVHTALQEQFAVTTFEKADKKALDQFAKNLLKDWKSGADINETRDALSEFYTFVRETVKGEDPDFAQLEKRAYEIALPIIQNVVEVDDAEFQQYKDLRNHIKRTGITFDKAYEKDLGEYESLNEFRKAYFGKIRLVNDGLPVQSFYGELASMYPGIFDESIHDDPADQLLHIAEVLDELQPTEVNPYSHNMREATTWLATDIIQRIYDLPQAKPTFGDKLKGKVPKAITGGLDEMGGLLEQQRTKLEQADAENRQAQRELAAAKATGNSLITSNRQLKRELDAMKAENARIIEESRKKVKDTITGQRMAAGREIEKLKRKQREKDAQKSESQKAREMRAKILRHTTELSKKLLRASDRNHISQDLQGAVAKLLESINLESNYTYDSQSDSYKKNDLGSPTLRSRLFANLRKIYGDLANELTIDPDLLGDDGLLAEVAGMADLRLADMTTTELETVWKAIRAIEASVQNANIAFNQSRWATISEAAEALRADNKGKKDKVELDGPFGLLGWGQRLTGLQMMTPEAYFHRLGKAGDGLFRMMRDAQDDHIRKMKAVSDFTHEALKGVNVRKLESKMHKVKLGGQDVELSTAQIMELYVLLNREQAREHIMVGGILPDVVSKGKLKKVARAKPIRNVQMSELLAVFNLLTEEQIQIAKKLQGYASTELSKWGNEAAMKVYNYEKFGEKAYWPIRVNRQETQSNVQKDTQVTSVAGRGFTKGTKPHANNSVMIGSIFDTFSTHASEMATYAAWLAPMEDINRIRNYTFKSAGNTVDTVKGIIDTVHGKAGTAYLSKLLADLSNGVKGTHETDMMSALVGNYKAASVGANLRVIIQQPTAILRALDMIGPQYLVAGMRPTNGWKKAKKYAPIAQWKDWGYFDINTGRQMKDVLFDSDSKTDWLKAKAMAPAGAADSLSWGLLWNAVETETKHKRKDLTAGTEEFYQAVAERFTEIVDHTQVVDGILQRSQIMRQSDGLTKMATSFMGEPTKQYNMMMSAAYDATHGNREIRKAGKRRFMRASVTLLIAGVANAAAQAIMDAVRDDDKEKDYWEKWLASFTGLTGEEETLGEVAKNALLEGNLGNTINPAAYIPYVKDGLSLIQGYDVSRMDMESIEKTMTAARNMVKALNGEGKYTIGSAAANLFAEVARIVGVPVANLKREVKSFAMLSAVETDNYLLQYRMEKAALSLNYSGNSSTFLDILFNAYQNDKEAYDIIYGDMIASGYDPEKLANGMETRMKKAEGVNKVGDLDQRFLHPDQQPEYDRALSDIKSSGLWSSATEDARKKVEEKLYGLVTDSKSSEEMQEKIRDGAAYGLDETEYLLYTLALDMYDTPNKSGELGGTPTNEEKANAIIALGGLNDGEIAYLWDTKQGYELYENGIDMQSYVDYVGTGGSVSADKLLDVVSQGVAEETYYDFLDMLKEVDEPTKSGKLGSFTQKEAAAAVAALPGLSREERAALWQSVNKSWKAKNNPWR